MSQMSVIFFHRSRVSAKGKCLSVMAAMGSQKSTVRLLKSSPSAMARMEDQMMMVVAKLADPDLSR
jgi:hypothetical protein